MSLLAAAAATAMAFGQPTAPATSGSWACESGIDTPGGRLAASAMLTGSGELHLAYVTWDQSFAANAATVSVHWGFTLDLELYSAWANVRVPLRRKLDPGKVLRLSTFRTSQPTAMALAGPAEPHATRPPSASAAVDLDALLRFAGTEDQLRWEVGAFPWGKSRGDGTLDLRPLRAGVAAFPQAFAEMKAQVADFRNRCQWSESEPPETI